MFSFPSSTHGRYPNWLLVLAMLVALTSLGASVAHAESAGLQRDSFAYAAIFGVTQQEAIGRLELQPEAGQLASVLERKVPGVFAGLWIQHEPEYKIVVQYAGATPAALALYIPAKLKPIVEMRASTYSLATLRSALTRFSDGSNHPFDVGINVPENTIEVNAVSPDDFVAWVRAQNFVIPHAVRVVAVSGLPRPATDIHGGLALTTCTSGFSVVDGAGTRGVTTAGHCQDSQSYLGFALPWVWGQTGGLYDVQWHTAPDFTVRNWIFDGSILRQITSRTFWGDQPIGGFVCKYGMSSGAGCGTISRKDDIPACVPSARPVWVRLAVGGQLGDSGGPVFSGESAYGSINCVDASVNIYSAIDFVEGGVGVTVLTSP